MLVRSTNIEVPVMSCHTALLAAPRTFSFRPPEAKIRSAEHKDSNMQLPMVHRTTTQNSQKKPLYEALSNNKENQGRHPLE